MFRKSAFIVLLIFGLISNVYSETCDFLPQATQPEWTFDSPAIEDYYVGVGLAESEDLSANEQIERARKSALNDLSNNIEVRVKSGFSSEIREERLGDSVVTKKDFRQLTETITNTVVKDVEVAFTG